MIVCVECKEIIIGEMAETAKGARHLGGCPSVMTTSKDLAPFGQRLTVDRRTVNLSDQQLDAIQRLAKAIYVLDGELTVDNILNMWPSDIDELKISGAKPGKPTLEIYLRTTAFIQDMARRGVRLDEMSQQLTTEQIAFVEIVRNPEGRKLSVMMKRAGVSKYKFDGWMKQPLFRKYVTAAIGDDTKQALLLSEIPLAQKAMEGDMNAIKFLYEWQDKYNPTKAANATDAMEFVRIVLSAVQEELAPVANGAEILAKIQKNIELKQLAMGAGK